MKIYNVTFSFTDLSAARAFLAAATENGWYAVLVDAETQEEVEDDD